MVRLFVYNFLLFIAVPVFAQPDTITMPLNEAFSYYQNILAKNPESLYANYGLAKAHYMNNNFVASISISKKYSNKNNLFQSDFIVLQSMSLIASQKMDKAINLLTRAMELFPDNCEMYYYRAFAYYKINDLPRAFEDTRKSIQIKKGFIPSHLLLGIIMYERNNDRNALIPMYYALLLNSKAEWSEKTLFIIHSILNQKHERIVIPIHEERYKIKKIEELITVYCSGYKLDEWQPTIENIVAFTSVYIKDNNKISLQNLDHCYSDFFYNLTQSPHLVTYCYLILQSLDLKESQDWYRNHSNELSDFADWIENNYQ